MKYKELMSENFNELNNINMLLSSMVNSYRLLIGGAAELNNIHNAKKSDVKDAIDRAAELGDVIDDLLRVMKNSQCGYCKYCETKYKYIENQHNKDKILTEIEEDIQFKNRE